MAKKTRKQNLDPIVITEEMMEAAKKEHPELFPDTKEHDEYLKQMKDVMRMFL